MGTCKIRGHGAKVLELLTTFPQLSRKELLEYTKLNEIHLNTIIQRLCKRGVLKANPLTYSLNIEPQIEESIMKKDLFL